MVTQGQLLQGNEAVVAGCLAAGLRFYAGYPITPANEIAERLSVQLPELGGVFIQMEDEIASLCACIGASLGGLKAATATSGPGFSLMQESLGYAVAAEVPCVIIDVQRTGPSTGRPTQPAQGDLMQARWGTHGDHPIIAVAPSTVQEAFDQTVRAFNLAERYRTPVIVLMDEILAHSREKVVLGDIAAVERPAATVAPEAYRPFGGGGHVPPLAPLGAGYRYHVTGLYHDERGLPTGDVQVIDAWLQRLFAKVESHLADICQVEPVELDDAQVVTIAFGSAARAARHAVRAAREAGQAAGLLKLLTVWPFPEDQVRQVAAQVQAIVVPEMNRGQLRLEVERIVAGRVPVVGVNRHNGEPIDPDEIWAAMQRVGEGYDS